MTEEQRKELEKMGNYYSFDFFHSIKLGCPTDPTYHRFMALSQAVEVLGYEYVEDGKKEFLGVEYNNYKLVKTSK